ncbi:uncharacterized protein LOC131889209 [Tigriopus californicus]|uniref:uncharacterized protein LOC131889209 n=1 Tax=Tigriopus californicus TaxID=6832 RepID=UPI0027DAB274|nr:uncharacterized protein LOC131889209 [Tigriopus californicus]
MGLLRVIRETFLDFGRNTSIAGLNNAMKAKSIIRSLIWLTLFSVGLYFTLVGIISVVKDYNQYPVVTKTELQQEKLVNFPAISICNHNRVHCNNLLTQYYTLKEVLENGTTTSGLNQTILILSELFDKTGCRAQVCDQIIEPLAVNRSATVNYSSTDWNLVRLAQIDCNLESEERELICYHLAFAYEETTNNSKYTGPVVKRVTKAQTSFKCGQVNVCKYGVVEVTNDKAGPISDVKTGGGKPTIAYRYPEACSSDASNNDNEPNQQNGQNPDEQGPNETQTGDTTNETSNGSQGGGSANASINGTDEGTTNGNSSGTQGAGDTTNGTSNGTQGGGSANASINGTDEGTTNGNSSGTQGAGDTTNGTSNGTQGGGSANASINGTDEGTTNGNSSGTQGAGDTTNGTSNGTQGGGSANASINGTDEGTTNGNSSGTQGAGDTTNGTSNGTQGGGSANASINGTDEGTTNGNSSGTQGAGDTTNGTSNGTQGGGSANASINGTDEGTTNGNSSGTQGAGDTTNGTSNGTQGGGSAGGATFIAYLSRLSSTESSFGTSTPGFIQECTYRGKSCSDPKFWFAQDTPGYGNCYSFNAAFADIDDAAPRKASLTGITNGN